MKKLLVLLACGAFWACEDLGFGVRTPNDLEHAVTRWTRNRPDDYVYAVERLCFCPQWGPVRVTVRGDSVVSRVFVEGGDPVPEDLEDAFPSVDGLFAMLVDAYEEDADQVQATYDAASGVPVEFWIDYSEMTADEEVGMRVTETVVGSMP